MSTPLSSSSIQRFFFSISFFFLLLVDLPEAVPAFFISMTSTTTTTTTASSATTTKTCKSTATTPTSNNNDGSMRFGRFVIPAESIFYRTQYSAAFVNLRPIVPGHVLIMPERIVPTMEELPQEEYLDMWSSVRVIQNILKRQYNCTAFNVAVQDGYDAGQSVPHVHVHILPRKNGDYQRNDDVYDELENWAPRHNNNDDKPPKKLDVLDDDDRVDRTMEMMEEEAAIYRKLLEEE